MPSVDELLDQLLEDEALAEGLESHLDRWPLPVDDAACEASADRLLARLNAVEAAPTAEALPEVVPPASWRRALPWAALAAAVLLAALPAVLQQGTLGDAESAGEAGGDAAVMVEEGGGIEVAVRPAALALPNVGRRLVLSEGLVLAHEARGDAAALFIESGTLELDDREVAPDHWVVLQAGAEPLIVPDGQAPPVDPDSDADAALEALRWTRLSPQTLTTLETLLEDR